MAFEHNENNGSVFVNDRKERDNQPDRTGDGKIKCPCCEETFDVWISGWIKKRQGKPPFMSMAFTPKDNQPEHGPKTQETIDEFDDDIPF
jgi:hypothetical protein